jgi:hypothetical protein
MKAERMRMRCGKFGCAVARDLQKARQKEGVRVPTNLDKAKSQIQQPLHRLCILVKASC